MQIFSSSPSSRDSVGHRSTQRDMDTGLPQLLAGSELEVCSGWITVIQTVVVFFLAWPIKTAVCFQGTQ